MRLFFLPLIIVLFFPVSVLALVQPPGQAPLQPLPAGVAPNVSRNIQYDGSVPIESTAYPVHLPSVPIPVVSGEPAQDAFPAIPIADNGFSYWWVVIGGAGLIMLSAILWWYNRQSD